MQKVNDMELLEWEGELETLERLEKRLASLEEISLNIDEYILLIIVEGV